MLKIYIFYEASLNDPSHERIDFNGAIGRASDVVRTWEIKENRRGLIIEISLCPDGGWRVRWQ